MAKVTVDYLDLGNGGMAYNYKHYTKEEAIAEYKTLSNLIFPSFISNLFLLL